MLQIAKPAQVESLPIALFATLVSISGLLHQRVDPLVLMGSTKMTHPELVLSARQDASLALPQAPPAVPPAHLSTSLLLSMSAPLAIHVATSALDQTTLLAKLVLPIPTLSRILLSLVLQLVQTMLSTTSSMVLPASNVTQPVLPALPLSPSTALLVPLATRKWSVVPPEGLNIAWIPVQKGHSPMHFTAEVLLALSLDCSFNCENCTSPLASDCSLCFSGFFLHPSSNGCEASCPSGFFRSSALRMCEPCTSS